MLEASANEISIKILKHGYIENENCMCIYVTKYKVKERSRYVHLIGKFITWRCQALKKQFHHHEYLA